MVLLLLPSQAAADGHDRTRPRRIGLALRQRHHLCWLQDRTTYGQGVQPAWELAHRVAVLGSLNGIPGTDRQSVDVAADVVNFRRSQLACVLAAQDSVVFVHSLSFLSCVVVVVPMDAAFPIEYSE